MVTGALPSRLHLVGGAGNPVANAKSGGAMRGLTLRENCWHFRMRVPRRYLHVTDQRFVQRSLKTDSRALAVERASEVKRQIIAELDAALAGSSPAVLDRRQHYQALAKLAHSRGLEYRTVEQLISGDQRELVARLLRLELEDPEAKKPELAEAYLGGAAPPELMLADLFDEYEQNTSRNLADKSEDQLRRWRNPRLKAIRNLMSCVGDKPIIQVNRNDARAFRNWWKERIAAERLTANSLNKDLTHLAAMLTTVLDAYGLEDTKPFAGLRVEERPAHVPAFSNDWIRAHLLIDAPLPGLNAEARDVFVAMINTGCRPSELTGLEADDIVLGAPIPYIDLNERSRSLKNRASARRIPLVGVSLDALRRNPRGFPTYRGRDRWSDDVNRYLRRTGILPTPEHRAYSLRHNFEDRMTNAGVTERLAAELMGHATKRERYGDGPELPRKLKVLRCIAL